MIRTSRNVIARGLAPAARSAMIGARTTGLKAASYNFMYNGYRQNPFERFSQIKHYSVLSDSSPAKVYQYEDVKQLVSAPEKFPDTVLIDVREPVEFQDGHIPHALNVPFKSSPGALDLSPEEFEESFGFSKPDKSKELVFYCLGGVRSTAAEELANTFGYDKRGNYVGSWEDWVAKENGAKKAGPN